MPHSAADLFGFQGSQIRTGSTSLFPDVIEGWSTLSPDPLTASINPPSHNITPDKVREAMDEIDDSNENSLLVVGNDMGYLNCFLDGSFPLGSISLGEGLAVSSLTKHPTCPVLHAHLFNPSSSNPSMNILLRPVVVTIPLLERRQLRDLAKLSSTTRELVWYVICVVQEMHIVWCGSGASSGAQELGSRFIQALESKQKEQFGRKCWCLTSAIIVHSSAEDSPDSMLDLTTLLVTGRASDALLDFLGSGEQMSERASYFFRLQALS